MQPFKICPFCGNKLCDSYNLLFTDLFCLSNNLKGYCGNFSQATSTDLDNLFAMQFTFRGYTVKTKHINTWPGPNIIIYEDYKKRILFRSESIYWEPDFSDPNTLEKRIENFLLLG